MALLVAAVPPAVMALLPLLPLLLPLMLLLVGGGGMRKLAIEYCFVVSRLLRHAKHSTSTESPSSAA